ncbi:MAG: ATP-binding protein [Spirochaetia bacterium]|nr:ATP-binding protein [Spirochaetia bacterium]
MIQRTGSEPTEYNLRQFFEITMDMLCIADLNGYFKVLNPLWESTLGYSTQELLSRPYIEFIHPDDIQSTIDAAQGLAEGRVVVSFVNRYVKKDGSMCHLSWNAISIPEENVIYAVAHDISKRVIAEESLLAAKSSLESEVKKRTEKLENLTIDLKNQIHEKELIEKELTVAKNKAEEANNAKSEFLSRMSHELRTPMNSILGFAQLLEDEHLIRKDYSLQKKIKQILKGGWHLLSLIDEVLDLSKIEAGKVKFSIENVNINDILESSLELLEETARTEGIEIIQRSICDATVRVDFLRIKQVFMNVLSNAIKYNQEKGKVLIDCSIKDDNVILAVEDTGMGISKEKLHLVFEPFERLNPKASQIPGTGIGLYISKKLMNFMNGDISMESIEGSGSKFFITIPLAHANDRKTGSEHKIDHAPEEKNDINKNITGSILYIEDNPSNVLLVEDILEKRPGIKLIHSPDAESGLSIAKEQIPDMILLDMHLPGMSGLEFLEERAKYPELLKIPVTVLSANALDNDIKKAKQYEIVDYLTKPLRIPRFLEILDSNIQIKI